jgi:hypothetical protein
MESCRTNCCEYREAGCRRSKHVPPRADRKKQTKLGSLILKRANASRLSDQWSDDDYDVLENGVVVGRIFEVPIAPQDRPWMWASGHNGDIKGAAYGHEKTREARWPSSLSHGGGA